MIISILIEIIHIYYILCRDEEDKRNLENMAYVKCTNCTSKRQKRTGSLVISAKSGFFAKNRLTKVKRYVNIIKLSVIPKSERAEEKSRRRVCQNPVHKLNTENSLDK